MFAAHLRVKVLFNKDPHKGWNTKQQKNIKKT